MGTSFSVSLAQGLINWKWWVWGNSYFDNFSFKLFELLGPDGLELIEKLLQNRISIVDRFLNSSNDHKLQALQGKKVFSGNSNLMETFHWLANLLKIITLLILFGLLCNLVISLSKVDFKSGRLCNKY